MTVEFEAPTNTFNMNNQTEAQLDYYIENKENITVTKNGILVSPLEYTVTSLKSYLGGRVVFNTPITGVIVVKRYTSVDRSFNYNNTQNNIKPESLNNDFDRIWRSQQEQDVALGDEALIRATADLDLQAQIDQEEAARIAGDAGVIAYAESLAYVSGVTDDAYVKVLQPFAGAITRTQHDKNLEFISVKDFGAVGDGIADDADAIIAAINSGAKNIYFNDGVYKISKTINLISNIRLFGGIAAKVKSLVKIAMQAKAKQNIIIDQIEFEGAGAAAIPTVPEDGLLNFGTILEQDACINVTVKNCKVHSAYTTISARYGENAQILDNEVFNFSLYGVILSRNNGFNVSRNWIHDSIVSGSNSYCVMATGGGGANPDQTQCKIVGNRLENVPAWSAIMSHSIQSLIVSDNTIVNVRNGVDITVATGTQIRNVIVANNYISGTDIDSWDGGAAANTGVFVATGGTVAVNTAANIVISGNIISKFGLHNQPTQGVGAILLSNAFNVSVNGNTIIQPDGISGSVAGIFVSSFNSNLSIVGNIVRSENTRSCITVANATIDGLSIVGNVFSHSNAASTAAKIRIQSSTIDGVAIEANAGQRGKRNYEEIGTNVIDGVSIAAPFGGRGIAKKLSQRFAGAAVTSLAPQQSAILGDVTIPDAVIGDTVAVGYGLSANDCIVTGYVIGANTVRVSLYNISTATISKAVATVSVDVFKHS